MKKKGFTLIEISISIALILFVLSSSYSLLATAIKVNQNFIAEKELTEAAAAFQTYLMVDFSRAESVDQVLDENNVVYEDIGSRPIRAKCIKLTRSKNILYQRAYINQLIYLDDKDRGSVWAFKNSREAFDVDVRHYKAYTGAYEIATHIDSIQISREDEKIYRIDLELKYYETDFQYKTSFLIKLQE